MPARRSTPNQPEAAPTESFESALERLEGLVEQLESGELPLEDALTAFEQGVALSRRCAKELDAAERRIEVLVEQGAGLAAEPFDEPLEVDEDGED
jgi:exodeoxyribonuclease VII small subunit